MLWSKYWNKYDQQKFKISVQNGAIAILAMCLAVMSALFYWEMRRTRTIILPSPVYAQLEISDVDADPKFIRHSLSYALTLLYSYTPSSAQKRFEEFLISWAHPDRVPELRPLLAERLRQIQSVKVSESIEVEEVIFERKGALLVRSKVYRYTLGHPIATDNLYLRALYQVQDGNLKIRSLVNLSQADYTRLIRSQELEGKKHEQADKKKEQRTKAREKKERIKQLKEIDQEESSTGFILDHNAYSLEPPKVDEDADQADKGE